MGRIFPTLFLRLQGDQKALLKPLWFNLANGEPVNGPKPDEIGKVSKS